MWILLLPLENLAASHVRSHNGVFQEAAAVLECKISPPEAEKGRNAKFTELENVIELLLFKKELFYEFISQVLNRTVYLMGVRNQT